MKSSAGFLLFIIYKKPSGQDRTVAERNYAAEAPRRMWKILLAGFFCMRRKL